VCPEAKNVDLKDLLILIFSCPLYTPASFSFWYWFPLSSGIRFSIINAIYSEE
jgi:hypothetical protein